MPLTGEDLGRIAALITESEARTAATLRTIAKEEIGTAIRESEARTLNRIEGRLDAVESRINDRTAQAIEASETRLLTEFHKWASPMDARIRTHAATLRALDMETEALSDRVKEAGTIAVKPIRSRCA
jgi:vacuolar-type H+-ATPase subunit I/STV1